MSETHQRLRLGGLTGISAFAAAMVLAALLVSASLSFAGIFYFLAVMVTFATLFLPGYVVLGEVHYFSAEERIALGFGISVVIVALLAIVLVLAGLTGRTIFLATQVVLLAVCVVLLVRKRTESVRSRDEMWPILGTFVFVLFAAAFLALPVSIGDLPFTRLQDFVRVPFMGGDPMMYYNYAAFFIHQLDPQKVGFWGQWYITDRTPLQGIIEAFFLMSYGAKVPVSTGTGVDWSLWLGAFSNTSLQTLEVNDFTGMWIHRFTGIICNSFILVSGFFVAKSLFGRVAAKIAFGLMMISSWFLAVAILGTPKAMSAYFVLMGIYFLVNRRSVWVAGAMIGLGYLSHPEASIGAIGCAVYLLWGLRKSLKREGWSYISRKIGFFIAAALVVLPWITWAKLYAGNLANLPFFLMPLDIKGYLIWNDVHTKVGYDKIIDTFLHTPAIDILYVRVINISRTLLNIEFANGYVDPDWGRLSPLWNFCFQHVRALTGAVPFALAPVAYYATLKFTYRMKREFVSLILVPFGLIAFLNGYQDYSLLIMGMDIIIVLIIIAGANLLSAHRRILLTIYVLMLLEFVAVIWLCFYNPRLLVMYVNNAVEFSVATIAVVGFLMLICYSYWSLRDTNKRMQTQMPS